MKVRVKYTTQKDYTFHDILFAPSSVDTQNYGFPKKKKNLECKQIQIYTQSGKFSLAKSQRSISTTAAFSLSRDFGKKKNIQI